VSFFMISLSGRVYQTADMIRFSIGSASRSRVPGSRTSIIGSVTLLAIAAPLPTTVCSIKSFCADQDASDAVQYSVGVLLTCVPFHPFRAVFDVSHIHLDDLAFVKHIHESSLLHFVSQSDQRTRRDRQDHGCHSRFVADCEERFQDSKSHIGRETIMLFLPYFNSVNFAPSPPNRLLNGAMRFKSPALSHDVP
jgi:hypothetical protein